MFCICARTTPRSPAREETRHAQPHLLCAIRRFAVASQIHPISFLPLCLSLHPNCTTLFVVSCACKDGQWLSLGTNWALARRWPSQKGWTCAKPQPSLERSPAGDVSTGGVPGSRSLSLSVAPVSLFRDALVGSHREQPFALLWRA